MEVLWRCWMRDSCSWSYYTFSCNERRYWINHGQDRGETLRRRGYLLMPFNCTSNLYLFDIPHFSRAGRTPSAFVRTYIRAIHSSRYPLYEIYSAKLPPLRGPGIYFLPRTNPDVTLSTTYVTLFFTPFHVRPRICYRGNKHKFFAHARRRRVRMFSTECETSFWNFARHRSVFLWNGR